MSGTSAGSTAPLAPPPGGLAAHDEQWKRKLSALLLAFVMGFLIAWFLHQCPMLGSGGGGGGGAGGGAAGGGGKGAKGSPTKVGQGSGTPGSISGAGNGSGDVDGDGRPTGTGNGDADQTSGPPAPSGTGGDGSPGRPGTVGDDTLMAGKLIIKAAEGKTSDGKGAPDTMPAGPPPPNLLSSHDFTYDSTGLPRYASGVTQVASGYVNDTIQHKKSTMAAIVTSDSFDKTVDWYKTQVPAGWHSSVIGDMSAMSKALSPSAIQNMLSGAANGGPVDTASVTAAANGRKTGIAIFNPPNQTTDPRSIMIITQTGKPTQVIMSKKIQ